MIDRGYSKCIHVQCALPGCNRVHLIVLDKANTMNPSMLIHCMSCLSTMETKVVDENEETGEFAVKRRIVHTRNQLRAAIESEMDKGCQN